MKRLFATSAIVLALASTSSSAQAEDPRWVVNPETLSSPFGPEDERGAENLLTAGIVLSALSLVETGEVLSLGIPLDRNTPAYGWRRFEVTVGTNGGTNYSNNEDFVYGPINTGTQIDGLAHFGVDGVFFNGNRGQDIQDPSGLTRLGIENAPPIITRGIVLDIPGLKGVERLEIGTVITVADIQGAMARQGIEAIGEGDVVIFHTGHRALLEDGERERFLSGQPGPGMEAARWLVAQGVVAVGGDSGSMEAVPHERPGVMYPVHQILLAQGGVHILENIATDRLVAGGWSEFLFMAAPLPFVGASSSWINPVAIR